MVQFRNILGIGSLPLGPKTTPFEGKQPGSEHETGINITLFREMFTRVSPAGISFSSTEQSIAEAFSKYGKVVQVEIIMNKTLNRPKGLAYVTFYQEDEAQRALAEMNGELVDGRVVFVDNVRPIGHSTRKRRKD
ncbi:hypothetical protein K2173_014132 [Erythroxylum novogranatense]|uniref:RRM domain-containing protein n=1 Tax=Erythroxylum novogranatense TaxID=1862640 RepID=A0AAV8SDB2_9ROSI|nr:hypothetical protein K2173_014132 [Erythroxylum novogranatense]